MEVVSPVLQHIRLIVKIIQTDAKLQDCIDPSGWWVKFYWSLLDLYQGDLILY